jgi:hypothetical protein
MRWVRLHYTAYHDRNSSLILSISEVQIFLQASETGAGNVGSIEDVEDENPEEGSDEMKIDLPDD